MQGKFRIGKLAFCWLLIFSVLPFLGFECLQAQDFPTKPINIVIPMAPGGQVELQMRAVSLVAQEVFGQPFVLRMRPGGGGAIGSNEVANAEPDGYTLLAGNSNSNTVLPAVEGRGKGPDDMAAVAQISQAFSAYYVQTDAPWKTFKEVIAWAKANPGKLTYGNSGTWGSSDFSWRWLEMNAGFTSRNIPYDGGVQCTVALLGGHVQITRASSGHAYPHWRAGKIRPVVVAGNNRLADMPDTPCLLEEGYDMKGLGGLSYSFLAPPKTPRPIIDKLAAGIKKITQDKRAITAMKATGVDFTYEGPDEFAKAWRQEFLAYKELAKKFKK